MIRDRFERSAVVIDEWSVTVTGRGPLSDTEAEAIRRTVELLLSAATGVASRTIGITMSIEVNR